MQHTIVLFGANGQVGSRLQPSLARVANVVALDRIGCDLTNPIAIKQVLDTHLPHIIVNAAAYTAVDKAEAEPELADAINATAVAAMADWAAAHSAFVLHYSTDYVFDGTALEPYTENAATQPLNVYGSSKHKGELALAASGAAFVCLRTTWVYDATGHNFMRTMLRLGSERDALAVVADQIGAPTSARQIADASLDVVERVLAGYIVPTGIYHFTAAGQTSWHGFAEAIFANSRIICNAKGIPCPLLVQTVKPIKSSDYPTPAARPINSCLDNRLIGEALGVYATSWQNELALRLDEYWQNQRT